MEPVVKKCPEIIEFSEIKMEKRELEANLTSIQIELSENEHLKLEAETKRDDLAKVDFRNHIVIIFFDIDVGDEFSKIFLRMLKN